MNPNVLKTLKVLVLLGLTGLGSALMLVVSIYLYLSPKLPSAETLKTVKLQIPLRIYSQDLKLIGEYGEKRRSPIKFEDIPPLFIKALLAAEDDRFYYHSGVDINGLLRAVLELVTTGRKGSGGSTITMQLTRNFFLSFEQTFIRKFNEILLALRIEDQLTKDEILTLYINKIFLGKRAYGFEAAAQVYYGKSLGDLNLPQLAMLAGLPKAPSAYNPIANPDRALQRRNWILRRMQRLDYISKQTLDEAVAAPVTAAYHGPVTELEAPYIAEMVRRELFDKFGNDAYSEGYTIVTSIDSRLQRSAANAVIAGLREYDWRHGYRGAEDNEPNPDRWRETVDNLSTYGGLRPAVVTAVEDRGLAVLLADGVSAKLNWEDGLQGLRRFISENSRSAAIKTADELFQVGDIIRVAPGKGDRWQLSQLPKVQSALVALDPENGAIRALIGGFDFSMSKFNRATQAERLPGSNFKPFIYTRALETGMTPASIINDAPVVFDDDELEKAWRPENDSGQFYGPTRLRKALYLSRNLVSIRILRQMGIDTAIQGMGRFGFDESALPRDLSLALGTHALTPLKLATGYTVFANGGYKVDPFLISEITDRGGAVVFAANPAKVCRDCQKVQKPKVETPALAEASNLDELFAMSAKTTDAPSNENAASPPSASVPTDESAPSAPRVLDARIAFIMDSMLKDVIRAGTGRKALSLNRSDIAGKTGTTNGPRDAWFSGYNPELVTTVWVGFDENLLLGRREYGGSAALPIWISFMAKALAGKKEIHRAQPSGVISVRIDPETGLRVGPDHKDAIFEYFLKENIPPLEQEDTPGSNTGDNSPLPAELF